VWNRARVLAAFLTIGPASAVFGQFIPGEANDSFLPPRLRSRDGGSLAVLAPSLDRSDTGADTPPTPGLEDDLDAARPKVRIANAEATARARQFIEYGDARFRHQQFADAYQRYRKAAESAPNLADAYFRQAFAQAALGRYRPAVNSIRRGLALEPEWAKAPLRLGQLYDRNRAAKETHLERLALAADDEPESGELMFLLGVELLCDDQPERARTFLLRAAELGLEKQIVRGFLDTAVRQSKRKPRGEEL
jgi:tetratricopeptide (TPR) repeat protein